MCVCSYRRQKSLAHFFTNGQQAQAFASRPCLTSWHRRSLFAILETMVLAIRCPSPAVANGIYAQLNVSCFCKELCMFRFVVLDHDGLSSHTFAQVAKDLTAIFQALNRSRSRLVSIKFPFSGRAHSPRPMALSLCDGCVCFSFSALASRQSWTFIRAKSMEQLACALARRSRIDAHEHDEEPLCEWDALLPNQLIYRLRRSRLPILTHMERMMWDLRESHKGTRMIKCHVCGRFDAILNE